MSLNVQVFSYFMNFYYAIIFLNDMKNTLSQNIIKITFKISIKFSYIEQIINRQLVNEMGRYFQLNK